jgi:predicted TIM-barrel fold metal-dependent hydrolase
MTIRDKDSNFIMIDNPVFDPIFNYLEQNDIPVIGHIGEPKNCWLPLDQMTTINDSAYFASHPEYHMYLHPEYPSYEDIIRSRDHLLEKHPHLRFIGAHLGSLEWDVAEIAKRLDKFPNMMVETAARIGQLQYQSIQNWQKVHDFFIKYQDRIMYGTDLQADESQTPDEVRKHAHHRLTKDST